MAFYYGWNSWIVELLGGALLMLLLGAAVLLLPWWLLTAILGLMVSLGYERYLDRNGWNWRDVGQRACGMAIGLLLVAVLR